MAVAKLIVIPRKREREREKHKVNECQIDGSVEGTTRVKKKEKEKKKD